MIEFTSEYPPLPPHMLDERGKVIPSPAAIRKVGVPTAPVSDEEAAVLYRRAQAQTILDWRAAQSRATGK